MTDTNNYQVFLIEYEGNVIRLVNAESNAHARKHANAILTARVAKYNEVQAALAKGLVIETAAPLEPKPSKQT